MTAPISVTTNGTIGAWWVPAFANYLVPKVTECLASGAVPLSLYVTGDGFTQDVSENSSTDERLGTKQIFEAPGDYTVSLELKYVYNLAAPLHDKARLAMSEGAQGFVLARWAVDAQQALAAGDLVEVYPATCGVQRKQTPGRNSVHSIAQKMFVTGQVARDVAMVA